MSIRKTNCAVPVIVDVSNPLYQQPNDCEYEYEYATYPEGNNCTLADSTTVSSYFKEALQKLSQGFMEEGDSMLTVIANMPISNEYPSEECELLINISRSILGLGGIEQRFAQSNTFKGDQLTIYPNPSNDYVVLEPSKMGTTVRIWDLLGRLRTQVYLTNKEAIDLRLIEDGAYIVEELETGKTVILMIQR